MSKSDVNGILRSYNGENFKAERDEIKGRDRILGLLMNEATKMKKEKGREVSALKFVKLIYARLALMSATQARTFSISSAETLERNLKGSPPSI